MAFLSGRKLTIIKLSFIIYNSELKSNSRNNNHIYIYIYIYIHSYIYIALHKAYAKQQRLWTLLDSSSIYINDIINVPSPIAETFVFINRLLHKKTFILLCHKNKNYISLSEIPLCILRFWIKKSSQIFLPTNSLPCTSENKPKYQLCLTYLT